METACAWAGMRAQEVIGHKARARLESRPWDCSAVSPLCPRFPFVHGQPRALCSETACAWAGMRAQEVVGHRARARLQSRPWHCSAVSPLVPPLPVRSWATPSTAFRDLARLSGHAGGRGKLSGTRLERVCRADWYGPRPTDLPLFRPGALPCCCSCVPSLTGWDRRGSVRGRTRDNAMQQQQQM